MFQYSRYCLVSESAGVGAITIGLQFHCGIDKAINGSLGQWESHGDIDVFHFLRNGMKHGEKQSFITKHYGIFFFLFYGNLRMIVCYRLNPFGKETCLGILGRSGNRSYFLRFFKGVEKAFREFVRKFLEITFQEFSGLMFFDLLGVEDIIVPIEECLARIFQFSEKVTFYFVQNIEPDKYVFVVFELVGIELFDHVPVEHAFVSNA